MVGEPLRQPPAPAEMNLNLGRWPGDKPPEPTRDEKEEISFHSSGEIFDIDSSAPREVNMTVDHTANPAPEAQANDETIGQAVNRLRNEKGLSIRALARAVGVSDFSIQRWEKGKNTPGIQYVRALDDYFGSDLADRFDGRLRPAPAGRRNPLPKISEDVEQSDAQAAENTEAPGCSKPAEKAAAEQEAGKLDKSGSDLKPEQLSEKQAVEVLLKIVDALMLVTGGLNQVIYTLTEVRHATDKPR